MTKVLSQHFAVLRLIAYQFLQDAYCSIPVVTIICISAAAVSLAY